MSDVTALVLSLGEDTTARAIESVQRQTLPVIDTIVIRDVSPFHRALNVGAARVRSEFFLQVDADMILDEGCVERLRSCASDGVGIVVGHLRDPLLGRTVGVKLFRSRCFESAQLPDSMSPETDFRDAIVRQGWTTVYALGTERDSPLHRDTFGEHRPDYTPAYTFEKFSIEGAKLRYRRAGSASRGFFRRLQASRHPAATIALVAAAHGIFRAAQRDLHGRYGDSDELELLDRFLNGDAAPESVSWFQPRLVRRNLRKAFKRSYELGIRLRRERRAATFKSRLTDLGRRAGRASWVALVGLCHGVFADEYSETEAEAAFALLGDLLDE